MQSQYLPLLTQYGQEGVIASVLDAPRWAAGSSAWPGCRARIAAHPRARPAPSGLQRAHRITRECHDRQYADPSRCDYCNP